MWWWVSVGLRCGDRVVVIALLWLGWMWWCATCDPRPRCRSVVVVSLSVMFLLVSVVHICDHHASPSMLVQARLLDNPASFGLRRPPTGRPRKTDDRDRRSAAKFSTPKHTASPDSSSCLQEGCRSAVHYTKYASAAPLCPLLPPSSSMCRSC